MEEALFARRRCRELRLSAQKWRVLPHHLERRVQAHIQVCFLTYVLWRTFGRWCHDAGLGDEPRKIFAELGQIALTCTGA